MERTVSGNFLRAKPTIQAGEYACAPVLRVADDKRSASDDPQVTKQSAESVPPEPRGLRRRGGERPQPLVIFTGQRGGGDHFPLNCCAARNPKGPQTHREVLRITYTSKNDFRWSGNKKITAQ